jgi:hypothetical protein
MLVDAVASSLDGDLSTDDDDMPLLEEAVSPSLPGVAATDAEGVSTVPSVE